jgi:hypothetical protein
MIHIKAFGIGLVTVGTVLSLFYLLLEGPLIITYIFIGVILCLLSYSLGCFILGEEKE